VNSVEEIKGLFFISGNWAHAELTDSPWHGLN